MTTPGGFEEIPAWQIVGSGATAYLNADFTPACSGGYHAAARYCSSLVLNGSSDWYLLNLYEFNLFSGCLQNQALLRQHLLSLWRSRYCFQISLILKNFTKLFFHLR